MNLNEHNANLSDITPLPVTDLAHLVASNQFNLAEKCCRELLEHAPNHPGLYQNLGIILFQQLRFDEASIAFKHALSCHPSLTTRLDILANLGAVFIQLKDAAQAMLVLKYTLSLSPTHANSLNNLKALADQQQDYQEIQQALQRAITDAPQNAQHWVDLSDVLLKQQRYAVSERILLQALALHPQHLKLQLNFGLSQLRQQRFDEAQRIFRQCLSIQPEHHDALINCGAALYHAGDYQTASDTLAYALSIYPNEPELHYYRGICLLAMGRFSEGWAHFHYRILMDFPQENLTQFDLELSQCTPGKQILLRAEQGIGDQIQFIRYASLLKQCGVYLIVEAHAALLRLYQGLPYIDQLLATGDPLPPHDAQCFIMSLAKTYHTHRANIPANIPYLQADPTLTAKWSEILAPLTGFRIALVWGTGFPDNLSGAQRSLPLSSFSALAKIPNVSLISIQKGRAAIQIQDAPFPLFHLGGAINDFADTAAILSVVDLCISVDTSTAHLGGALGVPTWTLLPYTSEWRWLPSKSRSAWYPNMRLFKQHQANDWDEVLNRVKQAIFKEINKTSHRFRAQTLIS